MAGEYRIGPGRTSIEVKFPSRPSAEFRGILKDAGYRWVPKERLWRAPYAPARLTAAQRVAEPDRAVAADDRPTRFKFGDKIDGAQMQVVAHDRGPLLVVAGPGAGKTATMVKRIAFLVLERGVAPEHIMVATFSRKAAKELLTRISNEFAGLEHPVNVDKMRIGTFHSLCQQILAEYADIAGLKNFSVLEDFDQKFLVQNGQAFKELRDARLFKKAWGADIDPWTLEYAGRFVECANTLAEERVSVDALASCGAEHAADLARFIDAYRAALAADARLDYADLQTRVLDLLEANPAVLAELRERIRYLIVDEYQDTNFIQEQLVLLLAGDARNVCVVGDDDQSLYRFRGATVQNILQFQRNFDGSCARRDLVVNYRSQPGIVDFCRRWMLVEPGHRGDPSWGGCRYDKAIRPNPKFAANALNPVSVVSCHAENVSAWHERMLQLVRDVQESPDFVDLNQVAFLCSSVKAPKVQGLIAYFERNGVRVSAPRANMFFKRAEVLAAVGCLLACFPSCDDVRGYDDCRAAADALREADGALNAWVQAKRRVHTRDTVPAQGLDYAFSGLFFELLRFPPFSGWLDESDEMSLASAGPARNLSMLATICARFESAEDYQRFRGSGVETMPRRFFNRYLRGIVESGGIEEYEDEREYAPAGCVSFMTVHQAKGMEFPVVVVCSLQDEPWSADEPLVDVIRSLNTRRAELERPEERADFDFWRKYYTAFSRAQDLLVLASAGKVPVGNRSRRDPSDAFADLCAYLPDVGELDFGQLRLRAVKPANIMRTYSFTSDVAAYQACPRRYKLFHELGFPQVSGQGMLFGTLVHQCIEDIHRIVKRERDAGNDTSRLFIPRERVAHIVHANRVALERAENASLKAREGEALRQVMKYLKHSKALWRDVVEPEAAVSEVRDGFVLKGVVDLVHGSDDCVEIVDFKTGKVPPAGSPLREKYHKQMLVYAHLVRTQLGREVSGAKLYFTSDSADEPTVDVPVTERDVSALLQDFDHTVACIEASSFGALADDPAECEGCPFAPYCGRA